MEAGAVSGGGGGPAPFLLKTYEMVDDSLTDAIVSWSSTNNSFVVWNPQEFARLLLPTYFKHNNFSSFIRQLNTYGFRKIDPEKWEFANEDFIKEQKHLLKNIHRRKPIHSHSHPQGSQMDAERAAFEDEIDRLSQEKASLEAKISASKQQRSAAKIQLDDLSQRLDNIECRQESLLTTLEKSVQNPTFVEQLTRKIEAMDLLAYTKRRRLPQSEPSMPVLENNFMDQDFSDKLRLELSPAVSDTNLISRSTQSSNEEMIDGEPIRAETLLLASETLELSDTSTSFGLKRDAAKQRSLQRSLDFNEVDALLSCQLNLSLASSSSSSLYVNPIGTAQPCQGSGTSLESALSANTKDIEGGFFANNKPNEDSVLATSNGNPATQVSSPPAVRTNDMFWEQFLTERPACYDNQEASSTYRVVTPYEEKKSSHGIPGSVKNMNRLSL